MNKHLKLPRDYSVLGITRIITRIVPNFWNTTLEQWSSGPQTVKIKEVKKKKKTVLQEPPFKAKWFAQWLYVIEFQLL